MSTIKPYKYTNPKQRRARRRKNSILKKKRRIDIVTTGRGYNPYRGYLHAKYYGDDVDMTGAYVKYLGSSKPRTYAKKQTNRKTRKMMEHLGKGNHYRKNFDFWWYIT